MDALRDLLDSCVASDATIPGVVLSVVAPAISLDWSGAAGFTSLSRETPLTPDAPFRIASVSKVFVSAAILRLVETGRLDLYAPVASVVSPASVSALVSGGYDGSAITVFQLLTHTSGLYDYAMDPAYQEEIFASPTRSWSRLEQIAFAVSHGAPYGGPGERFHYSDTGYVLLGEIIERLTGLDLGRGVRALLGLTLPDTYWEKLEPAGRPRARQYHGDIDVTDFDPSMDLWGGGGLVSTVADLRAFFVALFEGGVFSRSSTLATALLVPPSLHEVTDAVHAPLLTSRSFGGRRAWSHGGFWGVLALYVPDTRLCLTLSVTQAMIRESDVMPRLLDGVAALLG